MKCSWIANTSYSIAASWNHNAIGLAYLLGAGSLSMHQDIEWCSNIMEHKYSSVVMSYWIIDNIKHQLSSSSWSCLRYDYK